MIFECDGCGQYLSAENAMRGMAVPCPACGREVKVPGELPRTGAAHESANYFARHWRGDLPLWVSYWVNGFLGTLLIATASKILIASEDSMSSRFFFGVSLLLFATALLVSIWQFVGIWRAASNTSGIWAALAKLGVFIALVRLIIVVFHSYIPQAEDMLSIAEGDPELPPYTIQVLPGGTEVEFRGGMRGGCAEQLEEILSNDPQAKTLEIESPGGRILEAKKMIKIVREHGMNTYTSEKCMSAASLVLLSGKERVVNVRAKVGFHAGRIPGATAGQQRAMDETVRSIMQSFGVSEGFTARVLATTPPQMWYPTYEEMLDAGVVTSQSSGDPFAPKFPPKDSPEWLRRNYAAQGKVVAEYPAVAVAKSPLNTVFVAEFKYQRATDPAFLENPEYPLEIIKILQTTHPDLVSPIPEGPAGP